MFVVIAGALLNLQPLERSVTILLETTWFAGHVQEYNGLLIHSARPVVGFLRINWPFAQPNWLNAASFAFTH